MSVISINTVWASVCVCVARVQALACTRTHIHIVKPSLLFKELISITEANSKLFSHT